VDSPIDSPLLPKPPQKNGDPWLPTVRIARHIPWGYEVDPEDDEVLLPIVEDLELLEEAKKYLLEYSWRDVADWLSKASGKRISHQGLVKRVKQEEKRRRSAAAIRKYARLYQKALAAAEKVERKIGSEPLKPRRITSKNAEKREQRRLDREIARKIKAARVQRREGTAGNLPAE